MFEWTRTPRNQTWELTPQASSWLDFVRGIAALEVFIGHLRNVLYVSYPEVVAPNSAVKLGYFLTGLGHQAVIVFFVLSGFLIAHSTISGEGSARWLLKKYAVDRLTRVYVVLLPALFLTFLWDYAGLAIFSAQWIYSGRSHDEHIISFAVADRLSVQTFIGNVLFAQTIIWPTFGSNGALWSLAYEFWYYVTFPLCWLMIKARTYMSGLCLGLSLFLIFLFVGKDVMLYFPVWLLGAAIRWISYYIECRFGVFSGFAIILSGIPFVFALAATRFGIYVSLYFSDCIIGVTFSLWLCFLANSAISVPLSMPIRVISRLSFTLYVVHLPPIVFIAAWLGSDYKMQPDLDKLILGIMIAVAVFLYAMFVSRYTEGRTMLARQLIGKWLVSSQ